MAIVGDILIKLVADFAQFTEGMARSEKALGDFGKKLDEQGGTIKDIGKSLADLGKSGSIDQFSAKLDNLGKSFLRFGLIGTAVAASIAAVVVAIQKGRDIEDYANKIDKLAKSFKVSTLEAQALEQAARITGKTAEELNTILSAGQKAQLGASYKAAFGDTTKILEDVTRASTRLSDAWGELQEQSHQSMVSMFGDVTAAALNGLADAVTAWASAIREASIWIARLPQNVPQLPSLSNFQTKDQVEQTNALIAALGGGDFGVTATSGPSNIDLLKSKIDDLEKSLAAAIEKRKSVEEDFANGLDRGGVVAADLANLTALVARLTAELIRLKGATNTLDLSPFAGKGITGLDFKGAGVDVLKPTFPTVTQATRWQVEAAQAAAAAKGTGGGGGGKSDNESIDAQIKRYEALAGVAQRAGETISRNRDKNIEDLQREVRVQQQVEEIAAKLGAKYSEADEARKKQLHDEIELYERRKDANQQALQNLQKAEELEIKYGDGAKAREKIERDLAKAKDTNKVSTEALTRADKAQKEQVDQNALTMRRYDDNLGSLTAGFEAAAQSYARSHDLFSQGGEIFNAVTDAMGEGLDALLGKSTKTFGQIAADFATMLAKMALQAALSPVFKMIANSIGDIFGSAAGNITMVRGPSTPLPTRAAGGPVSAGQPYWVGEMGPEVFVPSAAGSIVPNGGGDVYVNIANYTDSKVSAQKSKGPGGQMQVDVIVEAVESKMAARLSRGQGSLGKTMEGSYGLQRVGR